MLSVYLEFCSPFTDNSGKQVRYEFRDLEKYTTLANEAQQKFNKSIDEIADAIRCERYFNAFMSIVNLAYQDGIIKTDINAKISRIHWKHDTAKEYLDEKEIRRLERVEFTEYPDVQRACLIAIYTGLRQSDILALDWKSVHINSKKRSYLDIIIHKTQAAIKLPLSPAAIELLSKPKKRGLVFPDLTGYKLGFYIPLYLPYYTALTQEVS